MFFFVHGDIGVLLSQSSPADQNGDESVVGIWAKGKQSSKNFGCFDGSEGLGGEQF